MAQKKEMEMVICSHAGTHPNCEGCTGAREHSHQIDVRRPYPTKFLCQKVDPPRNVECRPVVQFSAASGGVLAV